MISAAKKLLRKRSNRVGAYADEGAISQRDIEKAFEISDSSDSENDDVPVNYRAVGFYNLTSINNKRALVDVITHVVPSPTEGIFNKVLVDYLLHHKLHNNKKELIKYLSGITIIYLEDIELTPIVIRLLKLTTKYSSNIDTIVLRNITLTLEIIKKFRINEFHSIKNLIIRNIKLPNEDKEAIIVGLIRMIKKMANIEVLDFSGFDICDIYQNRPSISSILKGNTRYKFAELFNKLILHLENLNKLNFTDNIMDDREYKKIFEEHTTNKKRFEYWEDEDTPNFVRIYNEDGHFRSIDVNAYPNHFVDIRADELFTILDNVNVNVKNIIEKDFIEKFAIKGGRKLRKKKPTKPPTKATKPTKPTKATNKNK